MSLTTTEPSVPGTLTSQSLPPTSTQAVKKLMIVDEHPIVRKGLNLLVEQQNGLEICGETDDFTKALPEIMSKRPDLVIVDISLKGGSGLELIKMMRERVPEIPALVLSMHDEGLYAERALRAGARGYVQKQESIEMVVTAIQRVLGGEIFVSEAIRSTMLQQFVSGRAETGSSPLKRLSDRELEVFEMIGQGLGTRQIAEQLGLSVKTIETYRANIKDKLKLKNSIELVQRAVLWTQAEQCI